MARSPNPPRVSPPSRSMRSSITRPPGGTFRRRRWKASSGAMRIRRRGRRNLIRAPASGRRRRKHPEEPSQPELIWNGAKIAVTNKQMKELAETGTLTLSEAQLVWRGKDRQDWSDLVVNVPPLYIQEKIHPKAIIDDLKRRTAEKREAQAETPDLFADFNGITPEQRAEFYQHDQHWSNRMILGDSLQVMASARRARGPARQGAVHLFRSALRHQVQLELAGVHTQVAR